MIGVLPIGRENVNLINSRAQNFIMVIFQHVSDNLDNLLESVTPVKWTLFGEGFATLLCTQFLVQKYRPHSFNNETNDVFALLRRIPVENRYRHFADRVLTRFEIFQQSLSSSNWSDLMVRINSDRFVLNILEKTKSIETYFNWITKALKLCPQVNSFRDKFRLDFDERVHNDFESKDSCDKITYVLNLFRVI
jgi:hypothetical protein